MNTNHFLYRFLQKNALFIAFYNKALFLSVLSENRFFNRFWTQNTFFISFYKKNAFFIGFKQKQLFFSISVSSGLQIITIFHSFSILLHFLQLPKTTCIYHFRSVFSTNRLLGMSIVVMNFFYLNLPRDITDRMIYLSYYLNAVLYFFSCFKVKKSWNIAS